MTKRKEDAYMGRPPKSPDGRRNSGSLQRSATQRFNLTLPAWALKQLEELAEAEFMDRTVLTRQIILRWLNSNYVRLRRQETEDSEHE